MYEKLIAWGYVYFVVLIAAEAWYSRAKGLRLYRFADTVTDLALGVSSQVVHFAVAGLSVLAYIWLYQFRAWTLPDDSPWTWLAALLYVDFVFYWWHRWSHEVNVLWAGHAVHHQSEDYNLAVALRQEWLGQISHLPFYLPAALLGISWPMLATHVAISLLYQFWIHTEVIRRMGPFEWIFNAPMHHRVHHAINPQYLDKNYGGILIIWDKLFGTYTAEDEPCVYGTVKPIASWNSIWCNFAVWAHMAKVSRQTRALGDKIGVWLRSPAWSPPDVPGYAPQPVDRTRVVKYDTPSTTRLKVWLAFLLVVATLVQTQLPAMAHTLALLSIPCVLWALLNLGGLLEHKPWAKGSAVAQLLVTAGVGVAAMLPLTIAAAVLCALLLVSLSWATSPLAQA